MIEDFVTIYDQHQAPIFRYCLGKCRDREVSQDMTQETFFRFWLCLERKEKILNARAFLYRIAFNLFIDHMRKKKEASLDRLQEEGFEPSIDLWHQTHSRLDAERPLKELGRMRDDYGQVVYRRFILGQTPAQIAHITGETSNTVSVRIFRGLKHLRLHLEDASVGTHREARLVSGVTFLPPTFYDR